MCNRICDHCVRCALGTASTLLAFVLLIGAAGGCRGEPVEGGGALGGGGDVLEMERRTRATGPARIRIVGEVLRIGSAEGHHFGEVSAIDVDDGGQIYLSDRMASEIVVFSAGGDLVGRIGRPGSGPGELGPGGTALFFGPGDTIVVPDPGQSRLNHFLRDGTFVRSYPIAMEGGVSRGWAAVAGAGLFQRVRQLALSTGADNQSPDLIIRRDWGGAILDTVLSLPPAPAPRFTRDGVPVRRLFEPEPVWGSLDDRHLYLAMDSAFRIEVYSTAGELVGVVERGEPRHRVRRSERAILLGSIRDHLERKGLPPAGLASLLEGIEIADYLPALAGILAGPGGELWVQRVDPPREVGVETRDLVTEGLGGPRWDVLDTAGDLYSVVIMPARFQPYQVRDDLIYGVQLDEMGVPSLVVIQYIRDEES